MELRIIGETQRSAGQPRHASSYELFSRRNNLAKLPDLASEVRSCLRSTNSEVHELLLSNFFPALLTQDPSGAAALAEACESPFLREQLLRQVAQSWAVQNSVRALEWAESLADPAERQPALAQICFQIMAWDPAEAMRVSQETQVQAVPGVMENLVQAWASLDSSAAQEWVAMQPAGDLRDEMFQRVALALSHRDPVAAAILIVENIPPGPPQTEAAIAILHQWALQDPSAAQAWVERFPSGSLRERAEHELAGIARYRQMTARN